ncbi:MAG: hypothetical protein HY429_02825 [Candidatus Levybacteria bacterium]|nr:hypothetical protein [Candidatus Levybacteria bacterium]
MWKTTRTPKKKRKNRRLIFAAVSILLIILAIGLVIIYKAVFFRLSYISPLPLALLEREESRNDRQREFEQLLKQENIPVKSVTKLSDSYLVQLKSGVEVIFSLAKPLQSQVSSLQLILTKLTIKGKGIAQVDLRFDKPTITER